MKRNMAKFLFLAPSFLGVVIFVLLPFGDVVKRSFMTAVTKEGAGMRNYQTIFTNSAFLLAVKIHFALPLSVSRCWWQWGLQLLWLWGAYAICRR